MTAPLKLEWHLLPRLKTQAAFDLLPIVLLLSIYHPPIALAQSCAMERHVVDSWTATVKADQDAIRQLDQSQISPDDKLQQWKPLDARLKRDVQHLQQAKARFADWQKTANNGPSPSTGTPPNSKPATVQPAVSNASEPTWDIPGLGKLTFGQPDPRSPSVGGTLLIDTDRLVVIPRGTKLTMKGTLNGTSLELRGSTLTQGSRIDPKRAEVAATEYKLTIEAKVSRSTTPPTLNGMVFLVKSIQFSDKRDQPLQSFEIQGVHGNQAVAGNIAFQNEKMAAPKVIDQPYKFMGVFKGDSTTFSFQASQPKMTIAISTFSWSGVAAGTGQLQPASFSAAGWQTEKVNVGGRNFQAKILAMEEPSGGTMGLGKSELSKHGFSQRSGRCRQTHLLELPAYYLYQCRLR